MSQLTDQFVTALHRLESSGEVDDLAGLFQDGADIASPLVHHDSGGAGAAHSFWTQYRAAFEDISSSFKNVQEMNGVSFLEWRSEGSVNGQPFAYDGVSVLEEADGKITAFRTYFDTRHLPTARAVQSEADTEGQNGRAENGADEGAEEGDLEQAQREAAEQRAQGGYS